MSAISSAAGKLAEKLVELLDVFDLSFFVSGAVGLAAVLQTAGIAPRELGTMPTSVIAGGIVAAYFVGLLCFAIGRRLRALVRSSPSGAQLVAPSAAVLRQIPALADADPDSLYDRLWVHVRTSPELLESFSLVKRYWVLAATCDGLAVAVLLWNGPIARGAANGSPALLGLCAVTLVLAWFSLSQADEYRRYQANELVATVRHWAALYGPQRELELAKLRAEIVTRPDT
jgi:hypothetical protein